MLIALSCPTVSVLRLCIVFDVEVDGLGDEVLKRDATLGRNVGRPDERDATARGELDIAVVVSAFVRILALIDFSETVKFLVGGDSRLAQIEFLGHLGDGLALKGELLDFVHHIGLHSAGHAAGDAAAHEVFLIGDVENRRVRYIVFRRDGVEGDVRVLHFTDELGVGLKAGFNSDACHS